MPHTVPRFDAAPGLSVLIVDDNRHVLSGAKALLESTPRIGSVMTAASGEAALALAASHRFDLILLDVSMDGLNGLEVAKRLNAGQRAPKIVMMSLYDDPEFSMAAVNAGAAAFVSKLILAGEIERLLEDMFGQTA